MPLKIFVLLTPFIQLGPSYYGSVATLAVLLNFWNFRQLALRAILSGFPFLFIVVFMFFSMLDTSGDEFVRSIARVLREGLIFFFLVTMLKCMRYTKPVLDPQTLERLCLLVCISIFGLVIIQTIALSRGMYIGIPETAFPTETGTIPDELSLYWVQQRPNGTFSEPSYLGFIMLSFMLIFLPTLSSSSCAKTIVGVVVLTGLLSKSLSFVLAAVIVGFLPAFEKARLKSKFYMLFGGGLVAVLALVLGGSGEVLSRLSGSASSSGDYSSFVRIVGPMTIVPEFLLYHPFGVPFYNLVDALAAMNPDSNVAPEEYGHNGIVNMFFEYGVVGFLMASALIYVASDRVVMFYLMTSGMFNGAFLAIDKFAIMLFAIYMYEANKRLKGGGQCAMGVQKIRMG